MFGVRCTTPLRTITDLVTEGKTDKALLKQAIQEGLARGLITRSDLEGENVQAEVRRELRAHATGILDGRS